MAALRTTLRHENHEANTVLFLRQGVMSQEAGFRFQYPEVTAALRSVAR